MTVLPIVLFATCCSAWNRDPLEPNNANGLERRSALNTHAEQHRKEAEERQKQRSAERRRAGKAGAQGRGEPPPA